MNNSAASFLRLKDSTNIIAPHVPIDGKLKVIKRYQNQLFDAAAGIYSSVNDLSKWTIMQMNNGKYGAENKQLFSEKEHNQMWQLQTIIPVTTRAPYNTHFSGYGLGWFLSDVKGYKQVTHTGGLEGIVTQVTLIPELQLIKFLFLRLKNLKYKLKHPKHLNLNRQYNYLWFQYSWQRT